MLPSFFDTVRPPFRAVATTVVPEAANLNESSWLELEQIVEGALLARPEKLRRQLRLLIRALELLPMARYGKTLTALDPARRTSFLLAIQNAPILLLRRGFWGLRTLIYMGYYGREAGRREVGYRADPSGWKGRR